MDDLIRRLSEIRSQYNCFDEAERRYYHALSEAIRELSGRADGDTIYRQAAIDACIRVREHRAYDEIEEIKALPSAQPKRPTGEWIVSESEEVGALGIRCRTYTCPSCGWNHSLIISMNFCPNCGNDNRGEQDE